MACNTCTSGGGCATGEFEKMAVFDWLSDMDVPAANRFNTLEVRFKGGRKEFFRNINDLELYPGDAVIVEVQNGHHLGFVSMQGDLVRLQMRKKGVQDSDDLKAVYRLATAMDKEKYEQSRAREMP